MDRHHCLIHALIFITFLAPGTGLMAADRVTGLTFATRSEVIAPHGMVATSHPLATQIGLDVLKQGGSAVDAAIAANAALGLMEPTGNGMGGDLFAIVWDAGSKSLHGLNASGRSPKSLRPIAGFRARCRRRLVRIAWAFWQTADDQVVAAHNRLRP